MTSRVLIYFFSFQLDICISVRIDCKCTNNPDRFSYICDKVVLPHNQEKITTFVKKSYHDYFGVKLGNQDRPFASHVFCKTCVEDFRGWRDGKRKNMSFAIPMVWREREDYIRDYYFCIINLKRNKSQEQAPCSIL